MKPMNFQFPANERKLVYVRDTAWRQVGRVYRAQTNRAYTRQPRNGYWFTTANVSTQSTVTS